MGRKRSKDENARHEHIPRVSPPVRQRHPSVTCEDCGSSVPARADNGKPMAHYIGDGRTWCTPAE